MSTLSYSEYLKNEGLSEIQKFYVGKSIFITGGTGFMGKIFIEKLLRSCPGLDSIYILIRSKKGKDINTRLDEILKQKIFKLLNEDQKSLVHAVEGELGLPFLGLSSDDQMFLKNKISIVVHCAATVRFDGHIKDSINVNVQGTLDVLDLCRGMPNLKSVVYLSTAFSNSNRTSIGECFYKPGLDPEVALALARVKGEDYLLKIIGPLVLGGWANTYVFTKAIAESLIRLKGKDLPITIVRPSIVVGPSYQSPMAGFLDNILGPTALLMGMMTGVVRTIEFYPNVPAALVPGDLSINAIIVAAWHVANHRYEEPIIFNFTHSDINPVTWSHLTLTSIERAKINPSQSMLWYPDLSITENACTSLIYRTLLHLIPAFLIDSILFTMGKQTQALKILRRVSTQMAYLTRFWNTAWKFSQDNTKALVASLSPADTRLFNMDMENFDWERNVVTVLDGIGHHILKVPEEPTPQSRKHLFRLKLIYTFVRICFYSFLIFIVWKVINICIRCMYAQ